LIEYKRSDEIDEYEGNITVVAIQGRLSHAEPPREQSQNPRRSIKCEEK
jgi:hypothetical protein